MKLLQVYIACYTVKSFIFVGSTNRGFPNTDKMVCTIEDASIY